MSGETPLRFLFVVMIAGCVNAPRSSPPRDIPFYTINTNLAEKAAAHRASTLAMVDSAGLLCYRGPRPWGIDPRGYSNYLNAHDLADMPAWHGMLMQAVAYEWAVTKQSQDPLVRLLARGVEHMTRVTGQKGLIARSVIVDYRGPRKTWMETKKERPTKYWLQGPSGEWYRNGHAKNHWNMTVCGLAVPLALDRIGRIKLTQGTRELLRGLLLSLVRRFIGNGYRLREADGRWTEFGDLRPNVAFGSGWPELDALPNGFNRLLVLNALAAAAPYDATIKVEYERSRVWLSGVKAFMTLAGKAVGAIGHHRLGKPSYSDMQAFATAATCYLLHEPAINFREEVRQALAGLWVFVKYENNIPFSLAYFMSGGDNAGLPQAERLMRHFPGVDYKRAFFFTMREGSHYQPIENRPPDSNYWNSSPFKRAVTVGPGVAVNTETKDPIYYTSADYLYAYWLGRFLGVFPAK